MSVQNFTLIPVCFEQSVHKSPKNQKREIKKYISNNYSKSISNVKLKEANIFWFSKSSSFEQESINATMIELISLIGENNVAIVDQLYTNDQGSFIPKTLQSLYTQSTDKKLTFLQNCTPEEHAQYLRNIEKYKLYEALSLSPRLDHFVTQPNFKQKPPFSLCSKINKFFSHCFKACCTTLFIRTCKSCIKKTYKKKAVENFKVVVDDYQARTKDLCHMIHKESSQYQKVFVISDLLSFEHLNSESLLDGDENRPLTATDHHLRMTKAADEALGFLMTKKFVILIPKPLVRDSMTIASLEQLRITV